MKIYLNLVLAMVIMMWGCGSTAPTTGETTKSAERIGAITISAKGYGKKEALALNHAKEQAFGLHARGASGGYCHHRCFDRPAITGRSTSARGSSPYAVHQ